MNKPSHPFSGILVRFQSKDPQITESGSNNFTNELHVNLWDFDTEPIVDIGLMVSFDEEFDKILIDVPWKLERQHIFDLGSEIDGARYLESIFNRHVSYTANGNECPLVRFPDEQGKEFYLIRLNGTAYKVEHPTLQTSQEITRIEIQNPTVIYPELQGKTGRYYLRFRLLGVPEEAFTTLFTQQDRNLLSSCTHAKVVDFRINTRRGVPDEVLSPAGLHLRFPHFDQIHFFLIIHRERELSLQGREYKACRSLEDEVVWNDYIRLDGKSNDHHIENVLNYIGHQWTARPKENEATVRELVALAKFTRVVSGRWIRLRFILIALLLGASSNGIWDYVSGFFKSYPDQPAEWEFTVATMSSLFVLSFLIYIIPDRIVRKCSKVSKSLSKRLCRKLCH